MALDRPQAQEGNPVVESGTVIAAASLCDGGQGRADLFRPSSVVRDFLRQGAALGLIVEAVEHGTIVGIPDGHDTDWFVARDCGHISNLFVSRERAIASICPICDEARVSELHALHVLHRLQHARSLARGSSAVNSNSLR